MGQNFSCFSWCFGIGIQMDDDIDIQDDTVFALTPEPELRLRQRPRRRFDLERDVPLPTPRRFTRICAGRQFDGQNAGSESRVMVVADSQSTAFLRPRSDTRCVPIAIRGCLVLGDEEQ